MRSSQVTSLEKVGSLSEQIEYRQKILQSVFDEARKRGDIINENYLLYHVKLKGILNYNRSKLYQDRLTLDSKNQYIRNFLPNYSKYQEDINNELDAIRDEAIALSEEDWIIKRTITREYKSELLKIRAKVAELKQKHSEGQNINISAVIVSRELIAKKQEIEKLKQENVIKIVKTREK